MDKEHFLIELKLHLRQLSLVEQQAILDKYDAIFTEKMAEGLTEYQVTKELGSPKAIAIAILKEFNIELKEGTRPTNDWTELSNTNQAEDDFSYAHSTNYKNHSTSSGFVRFLQVMGVICLNFFFMIWMIFSWAMILFSGWLMSVAFVLSPVLGVVSFINFSGSYGMFQLSISLLFFGIGLIGFLILVPFSKVSLKLLKNYSKWNLQILRGERAL